MHTYLNTSKIQLKETFTHAYIEEVYKLEHVRTSTKRLHAILDAKYEKADLHKYMETQCQNLTMTQRDDLLKYYKNSKSCSMEHSAPGKQIQ